MHVHLSRVLLYPSRPPDEMFDWSGSTVAFHTLGIEMLDTYMYALHSSKHNHVDGQKVGAVITGPVPAGLLSRVLCPFVDVTGYSLVFYVNLFHVTDYSPVFYVNLFHIADYSPVFYVYMSVSQIHI